MLTVYGKGAFLINTSMGAIVNEEALLEALKSGKLGGARFRCLRGGTAKRLDVDAVANVICTPHIGAQTIEAQRVASDLIAENIINVFNSRSEKSFEKQRGIK